MRCALVGAGAMARAHGKAFAAVEGVVLCGLVGRDAGRAAAAAAELGVGCYPDLAALWEAQAPELLILCVDTVALSAVIGEAVAYPWRLFMEKPPGYNLSDALRIRDLLAGRPDAAPAWVALNRRHFGATRQLRAALEADPGPRFLTVTDQQNIADFAALPGKSRLEAGNLMYANSIHLVDYFHALGRAPLAEVRPLGAFEPGRTLCHLALLRYANGDEGLYRGLWQGAGGWSVEVATPAGCYSLRPLEQGAFQPRGSRAARPFPADPEDAAIKPGFLKQARAVVAAAAGRPSEAVTFEEALRTQRLIHAIFGGYEYEE